MPTLLDVADEMQWKSVAKQAIEKFGKVHMVVNNAGVGGDSGPIENQEKEGWHWALEVNLMGVVYGAKTMTPLIKVQNTLLYSDSSLFLVLQKSER